MCEFVYGLDFGTSKTALARAKCDGLRPTVETLTLDRARNSKRIPTCLLRDRQTRKVLAIGSEADEEYARVDEKRRSEYEFEANFKPHVHQRTEAKLAAQQFLGQLAASEDVSRDFSGLGRNAVVILGRPASWPADGAEVMVEILAQHGYPQPTHVLPEPVGALFYHLASKLRAEDAHRDLLIIDWGAGTLDFTLMRGGNLDHMPFWGSNLLGGRLFDDLFHQWIIEFVRSGGKFVEDLERVLAMPSLESFLASSIAKDVKEEYSNSLYGSIEKPFFYRQPIALAAGDYLLGKFAVANYAEFEKRARAYVPSRRARGWLNWSAGEANEVDRPYVKSMTRNQPIDLLAWSKDAFEFAINKLQVGKDAIAILTGGSTKWKWFQKIVEAHDLFAAQAHERVLSDEDPELSIARGLCRAYAIGTHAKELGAQLEAKREELSVKLRDKVHGKRLPTLAADISNALIVDIADQAKNIFYKFACGDLKPEGASQELAKLTNHWLGGKGQSRVKTFAEAFSQGAQREVWDVLREGEIRIDDLMKLVAEVCSPAGGMDLAGGLEDLGGKVPVMPEWYEQMFNDFAAWLRKLPLVEWFMGKKSAVEIDKDHKTQAETSTERLKSNLPAEIRKAIDAMQNGDQWAKQVIDHVSSTLNGIAKLAGNQ